MKQNSSVWIGALVLIIVIAGVIFFVNQSSTSTYSPNTNTTTVGTTTTTTNGTDTSGSGTSTTGAKPIVTTAGFASVSSTTAVVVGTVIPNGASTTYWFEYGPTMSYGSSADIMSTGAGYRQVGAAAYITGLKPNTEYYFRIGANNAYGRIYGAQYKFITTSK